MKKVIQLVNGYFLRDIWDFSKLQDDLRDLGSRRNEEEQTTRK